MNFSKRLVLTIHALTKDKFCLRRDLWINYLNSSGYMPSHLLDSFTTAVQIVNIDIVDSLKKMNNLINQKVTSNGGFCVIKMRYYEVNITREPIFTRIIKINNNSK